MQVTAAWRKGRVDAVVQSTDKNFMVPVGGAVIAAPKHNTTLVEAVNKVGPRVVCLNSVFHQNIAALDLQADGACLQRCAMSAASWVTWHCLPLLGVTRFQNESLEPCCGTPSPCTLSIPYQ